jgi:hypothetical protein
MKTWIGFLAGSVFALGLILTCGGGTRGSGSSSDSGLGPGPAHAQGNVVWEYAMTNGAEAMMSTGEAGPAGLSSCPGAQFSDVCALNVFGAEGWEFVGLYGATGYPVFKRQK